MGVGLNGLSSGSNSKIFLKTIIVKTKDEEAIGVIEDNCSTHNNITHQKGEELKLKGLHVMLESEGINSTKQIDSKIYQVPVRDIKNDIHYLECYRLQEITKDSVPFDPKKYKLICDKLEVKSSQVKRPTTVHCIISAKLNHLVSDKVIMNYFT